MTDHPYKAFLEAQDKVRRLEQQANQARQLPNGQWRLRVARFMHYLAERLEPDVNSSFDYARERTL